MITINTIFYIHPALYDGEYWKCLHERLLADNNTPHMNNIRLLLTDDGGRIRNS